MGFSHVFPFDAWHRQRDRPALHLLVLEAAVVTCVSAAVAWLVFAGAAGLAAVFLVAIGMQDSFLVLLDVNRRDIWEHRLGPYPANTWLATALVATFLGAFAAFSLIAWVLPVSGARLLFASQLQLTPLSGMDLSRLQTGDFSTLLAHNLTIFGLSVLVALIFRAGGAMLVLAWNASVWALVYALLSRSTVALGTSSLPRTVLAVVVGVTPHLVVEASAYVVAAMVGIFTAKAVEKYGLRDPRFARVLVASLVLVLAGVLLLVIGAAVEVRWPRWCMGRLL